MGEGDTTIDIIKLLSDLESLFDDSKHVLGVTYNLDTDECRDLIDKIRVALPDEVRKASRVTADSEKIVSSARETAEQTLLDAQKEAKRIQQTALSNAERVSTEAEARAQHRMQEAESTAERIASDARGQAGQMVEMAQQQAEKAVSDAQDRADHLISESEVLRMASAQAKEILASADYESREMRRGAEEYAREELIRFEKALSDGLLAVQKGRMKLDQRLGVSPEQVQTHYSNGNRHANGRAGEPVGSRR